MKLGNQSRGYTRWRRRRGDKWLAIPLPGYSILLPDANVLVGGGGLQRCQRYSTTTHTLNNDMRRIKLTIAMEGNASDKKCSVEIPNDPGVILPGYWMLFMLRNGVASHAERYRPWPNERSL